MSQKATKAKPPAMEPDLQLLTVPLSSLDLSALNPRQLHDADEIAMLAESIRVCGLLQNLAALDKDGKLEVVAGGRRLRALRMLESQGHAVGDVPVLVTSDSALARSWAMAENTARSDLNPADEVQAYSAMAREGIAIPAIAASFGVTEARVAQRLKLASLPAGALDSLRESRINISQAGALTLCQSEEQVDEMLQLAAQRAFSADQIRACITGDRVRASRDRRLLFVGLQTYLDAGGAVTRDMFSDEVLIEDVALLEDLFEQRAEAVRLELLEKGWSWVELLQDHYLPWNVGDRCKRIWPDVAEDDDPDAADFSAAQRAVAGGFMCIGSRGEIATSFAFVRREDIARAVEAGVIEAPEQPVNTDEADDAGATFSAAVTEDLRALRLHAVQAALLDHPELAMQIVAYALSQASGQACPIMDARIGAPSITPSQAEGFEPDRRLIAEDGSRETFEAFAARQVDEREAALLQALVRGLNYGFRFHGPISPVFEDLEHAAGANIRRHWTPTKSNFFARVPSAYLDQVYREIFELEPSAEDARGFSKMKKGEKANLLHMLFNSPEADLRPYRLMTDAALERLRAWAPSFE